MPGDDPGSRAQSAVQSARRTISRCGFAVRTAEELTLDREMIRKARAQIRDSQESVESSRQAIRQSQALLKKV